VRVVVAVTDLITRSRIRDAARVAGVELLLAMNAETLADVARDADVDRFVLDLADQRYDALDAIRRLKSDGALAGVAIVGFFPHVNTELRQAALDAGCDTVLPRSAFVAHLAEVLVGEYPRPAGGTPS
jgi:CheY-like chemotaxis protein